MKRAFNNLQPVAIDPVEPSTIRSSIEVTGLAGTVTDINVVVDVSHTFTRDLTLVLTGPRGQRVRLVEAEGGSGDDLQVTVFDDEAPRSIAGGRAPFRGTFQPEESLEAFDDTDPNGTWTLGIVDDAFRDGGALNGWVLEVETDTACNAGPFVFRNMEAVRIDPGGPNTVISPLVVRGFEESTIDEITVTVDIDHTYDSDLVLTLIHPSGQRVILAENEGAWGNDYRDTTFSDTAESSISGASPPFRGAYRPEGALAVLRGEELNGNWALEVRDLASQDGGFLNEWSLTIRTRGPQEPRGARPFEIRVNFLGGLRPSHQQVFAEAAQRWSRIIVGDLPSVTVDGEVIDDVIIDALGADLDGPEGVLGQAGPTLVRADSLLPLRGIMEFDIADLDALEADGSLLAVIIHEMGHVLGIGTLWEDLGLLVGAGTQNPVFLGPNATREYGVLIGADVSTPVPVANTGRAGTRDGHWRESTFDDELMTGFINDGVANPLSRLTVASLQDLGYTVDYDRADAYALPGPRALRAVGQGPCRRCCRAVAPGYRVVGTPVPEGDLTT